MWLPTRRQLLAIISSSGVPLLAGCGENQENEGNEQQSPTNTEKPDTPDSTATPEKTPSPTPTPQEQEAIIEVEEFVSVPEELSQLEETEVSVSVVNSGDNAGQEEIELILDDTVNQTETVEIEAGETETVRFDISFAEAGEHSVRVGGATTSVTVLDTTFVVDVAEMDYWPRLTLSCLQGLVNQNGTEVYLRYKQADERWLNWYEEEYGMNSKTLTSPYQLISHYADSIDGYVIVDPTVPDSGNVAATYAGRDDVLPIREEMVDEHELPELEYVHDLRGRYRGWSKAEIYEHAKEELWADVNQGVVANITSPHTITIDVAEYTESSDTIYLRFKDNQPEDGFGPLLQGLHLMRDEETIATVQPGTERENEILVENGGSWLYEGDRAANKDQYWVYRLDGVKNADKIRMAIRFEYLVEIGTSLEGPFDTIAESTTKYDPIGWNQIRDYVVSEGGFCFELDSRESYSEERELKGEFLSELSEPGYLLGWVARFNNGSEPHHVRQASKHGALVLASLHDSTNYSVHSRMDINPGMQPNTVQPEDVTVSDKVYLSFELSDGDSVWMHSVFQSEDWLSDNRGDIPFGWEIQPLLKDLAPGILDHYFKTATDNDEFVAAASGLGSQFPNHKTDEQLRDYLSRTRPYLQDLDLQSLWVRTDEPDGVSDDTAAIYADELGDQLYGVCEFYTGDREGTCRVLDGMSWLPTELPNAKVDPVSREELIEDITTKIRSIKRESTERPLFIPIHLPMTQPINNPPGKGWNFDMAVEIVDRLDEEKFEVVTPSELFVAYFKQHHN
jgi:hypothetical protein